MVVEKMWKDKIEWFEVSLESCLEKLVSNYLSKEDVMCSLEQGDTLQTVVAYYKKK
jgi:hypothetical protein|tara:strand:+ start:964 stop:1131 length:168 start_codon:yes stop_codon:yes gene_type:complete